MTRLDHYASSPNRGRIVPEERDSSIRELLVSSYRLIYRVGDRDVQILAFLHQARKLKRSEQ